MKACIKIVLIFAGIFAFASPMLAGDALSNEQQALLDATRDWRSYDTGEAHNKTLDKINSILKTVNPNFADDRGYTPLTVAVIYQSLPIVQALIAHGADVNFAAQDEPTALNYAIQSMNLPIIEKLLQKKAHATNGVLIAVTYASSRFDTATVLEILDKLLNAGANIDAQDSEGKTALVHASWALGAKGRDDEKQNIKIVEYLLSHGANPEIKDREGNSFFTIAAKKPLWQRIHSEVIKEKRAKKIPALLDQEKEEAKLFRAVQQGDTKTMQELIKQGVSVNARIRGWPIIFWAIAHGQPEALDALIAAGAHVNPKETATGRERKTLDEAIAYAQDSDNPAYLKMIKSLVLAGADIGRRWEYLSVASQKGETPRLKAIKKAYADAVFEKTITKLPKETVANKNKGQSSLLPLAIAANDYANSLEALEVLLASGANINDVGPTQFFKDNKKNPLIATALMVAAKLGDLSLTKYLLNKGADADIKNPDGKKAIDFVGPDKVSPYNYWIKEELQKSMKRR